MKIYENLIIGGGTSGLYLASLLNAKTTLILEKNAKCGLKILASGGGRCNVTNQNISPKNYLANENFIYNVLLKFNYKKTLEIFKNLNFSLEKKTQFYCKSGSKDVLNTLLNAIKCEILTNHEVTHVSKNLKNNTFEITSTKEKFYCKNLIIATGGISYKKLGATGLGYEIAKNFNLEIITPCPALVGFSVQKDEFWFKNLSGVSLDSIISVNDRFFKDKVLFTHKGISGPAVLNASLFWKKGKISINFAPKINIKNLKNSKKQVSTLMQLPKNFTKEFLHSQNLSDKPYDNFSTDEKAKFNKIFNYEFAPAGNFGFERAEITKGGISTDELSENFESKKVSNLYFIGEVLDVNGMLGGYNLHFAFASANIASQKINLNL